MVWQTGILVEVEHVKAHRTKKEKKNVSHFEKFVTEGNERAVSWQNKEHCWMKVSWRKRERKVCSRKRGGVRRFAVCSQLPLLSRTMKAL